MRALRADDFANGARRQVHILVQRLPKVSLDATRRRSRVKNEER
jgi:hypothetical protein